MTLTIQALDHLVVQVSDLEASAEWYGRVLGMTREDVAHGDGHERGSGDGARGDGRASHEGASAAREHFGEGGPCGARGGSGGGLDGDDVRPIFTKPGFGIRLSSEIEQVTVGLLEVCDRA